MSKRTDKELLQDICEAGRRIEAYIKNRTYRKFCADTKTQDAVVRNLEIIGEATKHVSAALKRAHDEIPWKKIAGMRDRLIHDYSGVNIDIVWEVVANDLPTVLVQLGAVLKTLISSAR